MAFPSMTKLIDLTRGVFDPRSDDMRADRIVTAGVTENAAVSPKPPESASSDSVLPVLEGSVLSDASSTDVLSFGHGDLPDICAAR